MAEELRPSTGTPGRDSPLTSLLETYERAFNRNDALMMNGLFAEDCTFVSFGGNVVRGKEALHAAQVAVFEPDGPLASISVCYRPEHITMLSETVAVVHARQRTLGDDGEPIDGPDPMEAVFTVTAQRVDGRWLIRMGQNTPVQG